VSLSSSYFAN